MTTLILLLTLPVLAEGSQKPNSYSSAFHEARLPPKRDLASKVRSILSARCAACHGIHLTRPKGKFGHVDDLNRLASDAQYVLPLRPDESKLWQVIRDNEMPPKRSKAGPLSVAQKQSIRTWIESGASTTTDVHASAGLSAPGRSAEPATEALPFIDHLLSWVGKFHVVVVHFPIALLIVAVLGELWFWCRGTHQPTPAVRFCVLCAAAGAVAGAGLGWLHAAFSDYAGSSSQTLFLHRWTRTAAGVVAIAIALLSERDTRRGLRSPLFRVLLFVAVLLVSIAAHLGGSLVYGDNFFNW